MAEETRSVNEGSTDPMQAVDDGQPPQAVTVYWRPGCGFCGALFRRLDKVGLDVARIDIWVDEDGAAWVRSVAGGNETVPTVRIGEVALVNPTADEVLQAVSAHAPDHLPEGYEPPVLGRAARTLGRLLGDRQADERA
jgi:mycoredoxin